MESWETYYEYYENEEWDKLVEYCLAELEKNPEDDGLLWDLGDAYLQRGDYRKALELGKYHYQIHPQSPNAINIIVSALEGLGEPVERFSWRGSPEILEIEDAMDRVYDYMLHKRGRKKAISLCDLYCNLSRSDNLLIAFSLKRFEENVRCDSRFSVEGIGEVSLSKSNRAKA